MSLSEHHSDRRVMFLKLGNFLVSRKKTVVIAGLLGILILGGLGSQAIPRLQNSGYTVPNSDSAKATQYLEKTFNAKDFELVYGHSVSLSSIITKRIKRRQIQLVKKLD